MRPFAVVATCLTLLTILLSSPSIRPKTGLANCSREGKRESKFREEFGDGYRRSDQWGHSISCDLFPRHRR